MKLLCINILTFKGDKMKRTFLLLSIAIAMIISMGPRQAQSQALTELTFKAFDGTWSQVSGGTLLTTNADDNTYIITGFPFNFKYDNQYYDACYMNANGLLTFRPNTGSYYSYWTYDVNYNRPTIHCMHEDLRIWSGEMRVVVQGTAPNRVLIFQWLNVDFYYRYYGDMDFQVRLYETSNNIEIIYGNMNRGNYNFNPSYMWTWAGTHFSGRSSANYIVVYPQVATSDFRAYYSTGSPPPPYGNDKALRTNQEFALYHPGLTFQLSSYPSIVNAYPQQDAILSRGQIYNNVHKPGVVVSNFKEDATNVVCSYKISGPLPKDGSSYKTIYEGTYEGDLENLYFQITQNGVNRLTHAKNIAARTSPDNDGALDLQTNASDIPGGEYLVEAELKLTDVDYAASLPHHTFVIALDDDLAITHLEAPKNKERKKYPLSSGNVPVTVRVTNLGLNEIDHFIVYATITDENGTEVYDEEYEWESTPGLSTSQYVTCDFPNYRPQNVGDFTIDFYVDNLTSVDDDERNNYMPRQSADDYVFTVAHEIEAEALEIIRPEGQIYVGRPVTPRAKFGNNGVSDISDINSNFKIYDPNANVVYSQNHLIQDVPSGRYNTATVDYPMEWIPQQQGRYNACITITSSQDPYTDNNSICQEFDVIGALEGIYTISENGSGANNFETFHDALDALYLRGVSGPVTFYLMDDEYEVASIGSLSSPALDLSSMIIGVSKDSPIVFKPATSKSSTRESVKINLSSMSGIGILFGQNDNPDNLNAAVHIVGPSRKRDYANSAGYITFDGGPNKSILFTMDVPNEQKFRAPIYLGQGAQNITVKNCVIKGGVNQEASYENVIPCTFFNTSQNGFVFDGDVNHLGQTYSSGIVIRNTPPAEAKTGSNLLNLDTLKNTNIKIMNNEISGFGYGVVSLGLGPLFYSSDEYSGFRRYYNENNEITNNKIYNVARAGIFLGYEEKTEVSFNRIYNVNGYENPRDVAGIVAGGDENDGYFGYNNVELNITGNEISNLTSDTPIYGIKIQQSQTELFDPAKGMVYFPDTDENNYIVNNAIHSFSPIGSDCDRYGIRIFTERATLGDFDEPLMPKYFMRNDIIANNTIFISNDGKQSTGLLAGIAAQQTKGIKLVNNAIAIEDNTIDDNTEVAAAIFYHGMVPKEGGITSNRNAYSIDKSTATMFRFIETDKISRVLEYGTNNEFNNLNQWQLWTGEDMNSVSGDFMTDMDLFGTTPKSLRVKVEPQAPLNSMLNNRGMSIEGLTTDIDGETRGVGAQRYDIGCDEFSGRMYTTDIEVFSIIAPGAYRSGTGMFSDAEYIMTGAPVDVVARLRNNGATALDDVEVSVKVYRQLATGAFEEIPTLEKTMTVDISSTESVDLSFELADENGGGDDFVPNTYGDLRGSYTGRVPDQFKAMVPNVTPIYKIVVEAQPDVYIENNKFEKDVRFYLKRSAIGLLITGENIDADLYPREVTADNPSLDEIAGRLNVDSLVAAFRELGWVIDMTLEQPRYDIDLFDRNNWEPRSVDYTPYRSVLWADGDDKPLTRYQSLDLVEYLSTFNLNEKKNFIMCSQEMVRENIDFATLDDPDRVPTDQELFVEKELRAKYRAPGNPLGDGISNDGNAVVGLSVARGFEHTLATTEYDNNVNADEPPYCGIMDINEEGNGTSRLGYYSKNPMLDPADDPVSPTEKNMGITTVTLDKNIIFLAADWRHLTDLQLVLRTMFDYINGNGGKIVPVELLSFDAQQNGKSVELLWSTISEDNSSHFDIERADVSKSNQSEFIRIQSVNAAGESSLPKYYDPVIDNDVEYGSTYIYRLKMVDRDGEFEYSPEKTVTLTYDGNAVIGTFSEAIPNPASDIAKIEYELSGNLQANVSLYDVSGRKIADVFDGTLSAGSGYITVDVNQLSSGSYTLIISIEGRQMSRLIKVVR